MKGLKYERCLQCGKDLNSCVCEKDKRFCSLHCRTRYYGLKKLIGRAEDLKENGVEGVDYVIDRWNGLPTPRIYGAWFKSMHPDRTWEEYKSEFPDDKYQCSKDFAATTEHSGEHMKTEKYRKLFSEKMKGDKNPRHKSRVSEKEIRENSPYCEEFYIKRGLPIEDRNAVIDKCNTNRISYFSKQYWIERGYSEEDATKKIHSIQARNGLPAYIKQYGEVEGTKKYNDRIERYSKLMSEKYHNGEYSTKPKCGGYRVSKFERCLIDECVSQLGLDIKEVYSYNSDKGQLILEHENHEKRYYDFCYRDKIIEFQGDYWHMNPKKYGADFYSSKLKKTAKEKWEEDEEKMDLAKGQGYSILQIWESDFKHDKDGTLKRCIDFLRDV